MVSRMCDSAKDMGTWVNDAFCVSLAFLVKLERERKDTGGAKNKNPSVGARVV